MFLDGDADGVRANLDEDWQVTENGPMRLHEADLHTRHAASSATEKR